MTCRFLPFAVLLLASPAWAEDQPARDIHLDESPFKDVEPGPAPPAPPPGPPEPPEGVPFVSVGVMVEGRQQIRKITYTMPAPEADDDLPPAQPAVRVNLQSAVVERENFDRWLFDDGLTEEEHRRHLDDNLLARVAAATRMYKLTEPQRAKLLLAGRGDIKRFFDRVEVARQDFETARKSFKTGFPALRNLGELTQLYRRGPFGYGSLFFKTLSKTLNDQEAGR